MSKKMYTNNSITNETTSSDQHLKAQSHIWKHIFSYVNSSSLKCAVQMRIPDIIHTHGKPMSLSLLLTSLHVHPNKLQHLSRLMRVLTHSGFFIIRRIDEVNDEEGYVLTPTSYYLVSDHPMTMVPFLLAVLDPVLLKPWKCLTTWFQNDDQSPFETANGRCLWEQAAIDPQLNDFFNKAMSSDASLVANVVLDKCRGVFEGLMSLVDVGGGTGTMGYCISKAFPEMRCVNFDLPHVVAGLDQGSMNLTNVEGDMFESIPQANAVLLKSIMHDWSDDECIKILTNCREAIAKENGGKGGKVIIIDMVVTSEDKAVDIEVEETQLLFDMVMLTLVTGRERTEKEWADMFEKSGFNKYKITHVLGLRSVIEVFP